MTSFAPAPPPDQRQRERALDPSRSILVQAPAGSGKTDLLTRRFLRLLSEVADPAQIVAITFTKAAAAEMRHRIVAELEKATLAPSSPSALDEFSMGTLARRAILRSQALGWNLLELPAQLRISTIDSFCRELALQQPLLSGLGEGLDVSEQPDELYRRAARRTLQQLAIDNLHLNPAIESILLRRDNGWQELENQLVLMLAQRDRWMHDFVLDHDPDWEQLRAQLERPFARTVAEGLSGISRLLDQVPNAANEALELARFACDQSGNVLYRDLAELAELPCGPFDHNSELEEARQSYLCLAQMMLTTDGDFRKSVDKRHGFPADQKRPKQRLLDLIRDLSAIPGFGKALQSVAQLPPARYPEEDWETIRACFILLRRAAAELQVVFAEAGVVDFVEVAQRAQRVLEEDDRMPTDAALAIADGIHHLLIDEFQDTSRRQHRLISSLAAGWPDATDRTIFVVGDPMQSIYFFRDADAELFHRVQTVGLELPSGDPLLFDFVPLVSNFRTAPELVANLNHRFEKIFISDDDSGIRFAPSQPARHESGSVRNLFNLELDFVPQVLPTSGSTPERILEKQRARDIREAALNRQTNQIVALIQNHSEAIEAARARNEKYRIAVLGRTRNALAPIASALRDQGVSFRAVGLEQLSTRPEVLDALALARALFNSQDRVSWLGVLRAPWCGLRLDDLHTLTSSDDNEILRRAIPDLLTERMSLLSTEGQSAVARLLRTLHYAPSLRAKFPTASLGTWLQQVWRSLGGNDCIDVTGRANLDLLWSCLDHLPGDEQDLVGSGLQAALEKLTASPDPSASENAGVQLMTIHKSKGLEFEVVIVPELQAGGSRTRGQLLSWLERGIACPDESGQITEFLVAPIQAKGMQRGQSKEWVDRVYRRRELQEMRRILYVAATRAREELHLFARPAYKMDANGEMSLCDPQESLLSTAWPALEEEVRNRFEQWKQASPGIELDSIAAAATNNVLEMPASNPPTLLRHLPLDYQPPPLPRAIRTDKPETFSSATDTAYTRHEGSILSRVLGAAVHRCLEQLSQLRRSLDIDPARVALPRLAPALTSSIRSFGIDVSQASSITEQAIEIAKQASAEAICQWLLSPHPDAVSESRWTGILSGILRTVQVDRLFRAGSAPGSHGTDTWWIIDYKTAVAAVASPNALQQLRMQFAPQLALYAQVLRLLHGEQVVVHAGLYYPRMLQFDHWEV